MKYPNTNARRVQTKRYNMIVKTLNWNKWATFCFNQMTRLPRMLNSAQFDENCQNWLSKACYVNFSLKFEKMIRYSKSVYQNASGENRGANLWSKKLKNRPPYYLSGWPARAVQFITGDHWQERASTQMPIHLTDLRPQRCFGQADSADVITCVWGIRGRCWNLVTSLVNRWLWNEFPNCRKKLYNRENLLSHFQDDTVSHLPTKLYWLLT